MGLYKDLGGISYLLLHYSLFLILECPYSFFPFSPFFPPSHPPASTVENGGVVRNLQGLQRGPLFSPVPLLHTISSFFILATTISWPFPASFLSFLPPTKTYPLTATHLHLYLLFIYFFYFIIAQWETRAAHIILLFSNLSSVPPCEVSEAENMHLTQGHSVSFQGRIRFSLDLSVQNSNYSDILIFVG